MAISSTISTGLQVRTLCRSRSLTSPTAALAPGHIQANLLIVPSAYASDFRSLCARNPVPCALLGSTPLSKTGDPSCIKPVSLVNASSSDFDIRTDLPQYNIYESGKLIATKTDVKDDWSSDHGAFLIGCSFSFESALAAAGLTPRHWEVGRNVPMYRTTQRLNPAGIFTSGNYVVSMRPYRKEDIAKVRKVTAPYQSMHGEPIAWGYEGMSELGIVNLDSPQWGDAPMIKDGEVPVFWGCGVTPQDVIMQAGDKIKGLVIAHKPGYMLVLDSKEEDYFKGKEECGFAF